MNIKARQTPTNKIREYELFQDIDGGNKMIGQYKKKPISTEALQWTGDNPEEVIEFVGDSLSKNVDDYVDLIRLKLDIKKYQGIPNDEMDKYFVIKTLEGNHLVAIGDYIIKGVQDEFYSCKEDIFLETYEEINEKV